MASTSDIAKRYFAALAAHDLDQATACWKPGAVHRLVGAQDLVAPDGIRAYFGELFAAFPDLELEVPHPAFDADVEQARGSIRKLAGLDPAVAWAGHADPVTGDVRHQLEQAAEAP